MKRIEAVVAAAFLLPSCASASSLMSGPFDYSLDLIVGFAKVTSSNGGPIPSNFFLITSFYQPVGPITSSTFNGPLSPAQSVGVQADQLDVTYTLVGFGPGGADDPIFTTTITPGAAVFGFSATSTTLGLSPGHISVFEQGAAFGAPATFSLAQTSSGYDGRFTFGEAGFANFSSSATFSVVSVSPVPLPSTFYLFAVGLGLGLLGLMKRKLNGGVRKYLSKAALKIPLFSTARLSA
ncbi:hypothetical protein [Bradyrhizobium sp. 76]|uniref:hypothetical protein n=1 Tax=Bradyrhizobium sp. 76 TaxID=2782680 RepID=UPI001FF8920E|nr:hypothetical protein [Bradyrhizobium sp. 76]MCK1404915.1 hypothetical protein [Bradyrhizobium sp. 76]